MSNRFEGLKKDAEQSKKNLVHYFQDIDKGSMMPTWYNPSHLEEENDWIRRAKGQMDQNLVPHDDVMRLKAELKLRENKVKKILQSRMETEKRIEKNKDESFSRYKELEEKIKESMPSRDEMFHVDGKHGMRARRVDPRIEAETEIYRKHLVREWKIIGKVIGENTNIERLRKGRASS
jgi:hypothetical protein